jgi:hypothetical protein
MCANLWNQEYMRFLEFFIGSFKTKLSAREHGMFICGQFE